MKPKSMSYRLFFWITLLGVSLSGVVAYGQEPTPLELAESGVTANAQWTPYIQEIDGVDMALVPVGCFMMGSEDGDSDEQPVHEQCITEPFWMDVTEVTQAQFEAFGGVKANPNWFEGANRPVERITWYEARDYCELRGGRLPTEVEFEYAARGPDNLIYPWGNEFIGDNVVYSENSGGETAEVGSRPGGVSWVGAMDMSGNVWSWTSSLYTPYPYDSTDGREDKNSTGVRALRGGSWYDSTYYSRAAYRNGALPLDEGYNLGLFCVRALAFN